MGADTELTKHKFADGQVIFSEGDAAECAYIVEVGAVDIIVHLDDGEPRLVKTIEKGGMFGELALIDGMPRMAMARASGDTQLMMIPRKVFMAQLEKLPSVMRRVFTIVGSRVRRLSHELARVRSQG